MAPKAVKLSDEVMKSIADKVGVTIEYKTVRALSENLNKGEESKVATAKLEAHNAAIAADQDEAAATLAGLNAAAQMTYEFKLVKAWNKVKKLHPAVVPAPEAVSLVGIAEGPARDARVDYSLEISQAYNNVLNHRVFKDVLTASPNPIRTEDAGDCGMQAIMCLFSLLIC